MLFILEKMLDKIKSIIENALIREWLLIREERVFLKYHFLYVECTLYKINHIFRLPIYIIKIIISLL